METKTDNDYIPTFTWKNKRFLELYNNITDNGFSNFTEIHTTLRKSALQAHNELTNTKDFYFFKSKSWWNPELSKKKKNL